MGAGLIALQAPKLLHPSTALAMTARAPQPSFSCGKATVPAAVAICGNPDLAALDAKMGDLYAPLVKARPGLRAEQRAWIRRRNAQCGGDVDCLRKSLSVRVDQLKAD
ncbi:MAG TPA: lysozyme inhibitor LprI family protein [Phenylobacterium sp.]|nr:lysozyme inhibitor LprI family protein [Phenylobacterium sp.]